MQQLYFCKIFLIKNLFVHFRPFLFHSTKYVVTWLMQDHAKCWSLMRRSLNFAILNYRVHLPVTNATKVFSVGACSRTCAQPTHLFMFHVSSCKSLSCVIAFSFLKKDSHSAFSTFCSFLLPWNGDRLSSPSLFEPTSLKKILGENMYVMGQNVWKGQLETLNKVLELTKITQHWIEIDFLFVACSISQFTRWFHRPFPFGFPP